MTNPDNHKDEKEEQIRFTLAPSAKKRFQRLCLDRDKKMSVVIRELIFAWMDDPDIATRHAQNINSRNTSKAADFLRKLASGDPPTDLEIIEVCQEWDLSEEQLMELRDKLVRKNGNNSTTGR